MRNRPREGRKEAPCAHRRERSQSHPALRHHRRISSPRIASHSNRRGIHTPNRSVMSFGISVLKRTIPGTASSCNPSSLLYDDDLPRWHAPSLACPVFFFFIRERPPRRRGNEPEDYTLIASAPRRDCRLSNLSLRTTDAKSARQKHVSLAYKLGKMVL